MFESPRGLRLIVLAAIVLCIVASLTGARAGQNKEGLRIAIIDVERLSDEYDKGKSYRDMVEKQALDFKIEADVIERNQLLNEADRKALVALKIKEANPATTLTKAELEKKIALEAEGRRLNEDNLKLQNSNLVVAGDEGAKKFKEYAALSQQASEAVRTHRDAIKAQLDAKLKEVNASFQEGIQKALGDVAKKNNYSLVLSKQIAPYAEYDCTKDVLALLNKNNK